jgi:hypothetical protein
MDGKFTPFVWKVDAGKDLEEGGLAGAIPTDDTEKLPLLDLKRQVIQGSASLPLIPLMKLHESLSQRTPALLAKAEGLGEVTDADGGMHTNWRKKDET